MKNARGYALLLAMLLLVVGSAAVFLSTQSPASNAATQNRLTNEALTQAKIALLGYASANAIESSGSLSDAQRPGDFPCPDTDDDGVAQPSCGNGSGSTGQSNRLGRLPWKTLGIPDLRDGAGERLWYAVSSNFKRNTRYGVALNNTTPGTISVRDSNGTLQYSLAGGNAAVAIIFAPGSPLIRPTSTTDFTPYVQNRSGAGINSAINYLDLASGEDNADFLDGSDTNGFITGPIVNSGGTLLLNDHVLLISQKDLTPLMEKRVAGEIANCLKLYTQEPENDGRYPWMAPNAPSSYADATNALLGGLPDNTALSATCASSGGSWSGIACSGGMTSAWHANCSISSLSGWWMNWKNNVTIQIAFNHRPGSVSPTSRCGVAGYTSTTNCLELNGISDRQFIVYVNGKALKSAP